MISDNDGLDFQDLADEMIKNRLALGHIADTCQDPQLTSLLMIMESSMQNTENILQFLIGEGIEEERASLQEAQ